LVRQAVAVLTVACLSFIRRNNLAMVDDDDGMGMSPKRVSPPEVKPVQYGALEIRVLHWGRRAGLAQNGGYIEAWQSGKTEPEWRMRVYEIGYDDKMEEDVQDCFIMTMQLQAPDILLVCDEKARKFAINLTTRAIQAA
jgi:hypothetical protein